MPADENQFLHELEVEVEGDLVIAESSTSGEVIVVAETEWLFDPTDVEREQVGFRSLLGAVESLEDDSADARAPGVD